jgi:hypothetical protein
MSPAEKHRINTLFSATAVSHVNYVLRNVSLGSLASCSCDEKAYQQVCFESRETFDSHMPVALRNQEHVQELLSGLSFFVHSRWIQRVVSCKDNIWYLYPGPGYSFFHVASRVGSTINYHRRDLRLDGDRRSSTTRHRCYH